MAAITFAFIGAKGGSGTTTVTAEFAKALAAQGEEVTLIDGDLAGRRGVGVLLDCVAQLDASRNGDAVIARTRIHGLSVVEIVEAYDSAFTLRRETIDGLAGSLTETGFIVADTPQPFAAAVRPFIMRATRFFLVAEPNLLGLTGARGMMRDLERFGIPRKSVAIITNSRDGTETIGRSEIERVLGAKVVAAFPPLGDRNFSRAIQSLIRYATSVVDDGPNELALAPSADAPIGDRRWARKSAVPQLGEASTNGRGAAHSTRADSIKALIHEQLGKRIDLVAASRAHSDSAKLAELRGEIESIASEVLSEYTDIRSAEEIARIKQEVLNEALGLGPLEDLLHDPAITEIMVNGADNVYVERFGRIEKTEKKFSDDKQLRLVIERIIAPLGRRIDESVPMVDARLRDGSRVNAIIEPLALDGSTLTIRRFGTRRLQVEDLIKLGSVSEQVVDLLRACVEARLNIIISGGTGSGKTTFLNILSSFIPDRDRIITIEDAAELLLNQTHVVRLESRPANIEGRGEVKIRDLLRNSLRMRPDRIVIGECRGAEALDMLQAMNTGHDGSLTTIHANSARDALSRVETLVLMAGFDLPVRAIREQISNALDVIIQTARMRDGSRKIISVSDVVGMEGDIVTMQDIVKYQQMGIDKENAVVGEFQYTGVQPQCLQRFAEYGITYDARALSKLPSAGALW